MGPCRGNFARWFFDFRSRQCLQFAYGGCRGNANNFEAFDDCVRVCADAKADADGDSHAAAVAEPDSEAAIMMKQKMMMAEKRRMLEAAARRYVLHVAWLQAEFGQI